MKYAALLVMVLGCGDNEIAPDAAAPAPELLIGQWRRDDGEVLSFHRDGTFERWNPNDVNRTWSGPWHRTGDSLALYDDEIPIRVDGEALGMNVIVRSAPGPRLDFHGTLWTSSEHIRTPPTNHLVEVKLTPTGTGILRQSSIYEGQPEQPAPSIEIYGWSSLGENFTLTPTLDHPELQPITYLELWDGAAVASDQLYHRIRF